MTLRERAAAADSPVCLYIARHAPDRAPSDPYFGLPRFLAEHCRLVAIWGPARRPIAFAERCGRIVTIGMALRQFPRAVLETIKACRTERPDVIVCCIEDIALLLGWIAALCTRRPYWVVAEDPPFTARYDGRLGLAKWVERRLRVWLLRRLLAASRGVFCFIEPDVLEEFRTKRTRIIALWTGTSDEARAWFASRRGLDRERTGDYTYMVGYVGAVDAEQGIPELLLAVATARAFVPNIRVKLIGPVVEPFRPAFDAILARLGLQDAVTVIGWITYRDMLRELSLCDVGCFLRTDSLWARSAFPLKVCEYVALAKPVIAWDYAGCARLLDDGRYGDGQPQGARRPARCLRAAAAGGLDVEPGGDRAAARSARARVPQALGSRAGSFPRRRTLR
jgi:glycosyltransferase involved in cell wall biosynthesis